MFMTEYSVLDSLDSKEMEVLQRVLEKMEKVDKNITVESMLITMSIVKVKRRFGDN